MEIISLGYRTDFLFHRANGVVADRGDYLVVRTPDNPTFYWGNFVYFAMPPGPGDVLGWEEVFLAEIERLQSESCHRAFGWNGARPDPVTIAEFTASGYELIASLTMTTDDIRPPPRPNAVVTMRPLVSDADYARAVALHVECRESQYSEAEYREYVECNFAAYRRLADQGNGARFGAFLGEHLVGELGLFGDGDVARYQNVVTHPDARRQGIAGTLVWRSGRVAVESGWGRTLVIVADPDADAQRIYAASGFVPAELHYGLQRHSAKTQRLMPVATAPASPATAATFRARRRR